MVAIDGKHNGYRHLILPLANEDELIMYAVATVSAFHLSFFPESSPRLMTSSFCNLEEQRPQPALLYSRTLRILKSREDITTYSHRTQHTVLLSLLVLMIGVMVTGSEDFPILYRLMESALESLGGEERLGRGDLPEFLIRQIRK